MLFKCRREESSAEQINDGFFAVDEGSTLAKKNLRTRISFRRCFRPFKTAKTWVRMLGAFVAYTLIAGALVVGVQTGGGQLSKAGAAPYLGSTDPVSGEGQLDLSNPYQSIVGATNPPKVLTFTPGPPDPSVMGKPPKVLPGTQKKIGGNVLYQRWGSSEVGRIDWLLNDAGTAYAGYEKPTAMPMVGVRVYARYMKTCGPLKGYVSNTYTAVTDYRGHYEIQMGDEITPGGLVTFDADPTVSAGCERWKVWATNPDPDTYSTLYTPGFGNYFPSNVGGNVNDTTWATNDVAADHLYNTKIAYGDRIKNQAMHITDIHGNIVDTTYEENQKYDDKQGGYVNSRVGWNLNKSKGSATWGPITALGDPGDIGAKGTKVYASYLSDYAVDQIYNGSAARDIGWNAKIRQDSAGWNNAWEAKLQNWIKKKIAKETQTYLAQVDQGKDVAACQAYRHQDETSIDAETCKNRAFIAAQKKWIAETVSAYTKPAENGPPPNATDSGTPGTWARLQFAGTYGNTWDACGLAAEVQFSCKKENGQYKYWRRVAGSREGDPIGIWPQSNVVAASKHVNGDWLFVSTETMPGVSAASPFHANWYGAIDPLSRPIKIPVPYQNGGGDSTTNGAGWVGIDWDREGDSTKRVDFALFPAELYFDVTPWDDNEHLAVATDTAHTRASGVPSVGFQEGTFQIEWYDEQGNNVKNCKGLRPLANGTLPSCDLDVPKDLAQPTRYYAHLYTVNALGAKSNDPIGSDSFTAVPVYMPRMTLHDVYPSAPQDDIAKNYPSGQYPDGKTKVSIYPKKMGPAGCANVATQLYDLKRTGTLPKGLKVDKCGVISGAPEETGIFRQEISAVRKVTQGRTTYDIPMKYFLDITVTDSSLPVIKTEKGTEYHAQVGKAFTVDFANVKGKALPHGFAGAMHASDPNAEPAQKWRLKGIKSIELSPELTQAGLTVTGSKITGVPTQVVEAHQKAPQANDDPATVDINETKGPNVWVTYELERDGAPLYKTDCKTDESGVQKCMNVPQTDAQGNQLYGKETVQWTDAIPLAIAKVSYVSAIVEGKKELREGSKTGKLLSPKALDQQDIPFRFQLKQDTTSAGCAGGGDGFDPENYFNLTPGADTPYTKVTDPTLAAATGIWIKTLTYGDQTDNIGEFEFPKMQFSKAGTYCFTLSELASNKGFVSDDTLARQVKVTVTEDANGLVTGNPTVTITKASSPGAGGGTEPGDTFVNVWNGVPVPSLPLSGGLGAFIFWLLGALSCVVGLVAASRNFNMHPEVVRGADSADARPVKRNGVVRS